MGILLLAALIGVPLIEIGVFIQVGGLIGLWPTLALIVLTALFGSWQLRAQGLATLGRVRQQLDRGALPTRELFDGLCLLVAGALLLTPGFVTDGVGFLLFLPPFRAYLRGFVARQMAASGKTKVWVEGEEAQRRPPEEGVIEGDYRDVTGDREDSPAPDSPAPDSQAPDTRGPDSRDHDGHRQR